MFKNFLKSLFVFDDKVKVIMDTGIKVCFVFVLLSAFILSLYISTNHSQVLYNLGVTLFKTSTTFIVIFFICGVVFSRILKDNINKI